MKLITDTQVSPEIPNTSVALAVVPVAISSLRSCESISESIFMSLVSKPSTFMTGDVSFGFSTTTDLMTCDRPTLTWRTSGSDVAGAYLVGRGEGHVQIQGLLASAAHASKLASSNAAAANKQARAKKAAKAAATRSLDRTGPPGG
jgi:hypothetical protein